MKKILLITGASNGIGAAIAKLASSRDYTVCAIYKSDEEHAHQLKSEIENSGGEVFLYKANITNENEIVDLFKLIHARFKRIDGLVNNAGVVNQRSNFLNMTTDRIRNTFETNVFGTLTCTREAIKFMSPSLGGFGGSIVNISSAASRMGSPNEYIDYAASKGAIDSFTIGLSKEIASEKIRVNAVRPGVINTTIHAKAGEPGRIERLKDSIPMKRAGEPWEVAEAVLWLLSDQASYITGSMLDVSGGR